MIVLFVSPAGQGLRSRIHWSLEEPLGGARPLLWRDTIRMGGYRLAAGYGPETFGPNFPSINPSALARAYPDFQHESPHNVFLDALVSQGIPGLLLFWRRDAGVISGFSALRKAPYLACARRGFGRRLASQQFNVFTLPTALYFYLMVALITASYVPVSH